MGKGAIPASPNGSTGLLEGAARVTAARFPQSKTLDDFDFSFQHSVKRQTVAHFAQLEFLASGRT